MEGDTTDSEDDTSFKKAKIAKTKTTNTNRRKLPTTIDSAAAGMLPKPTKVQKTDGNSTELETLKKQIEVLKKQHEYDAQQIRKQNRQMLQIEVLKKQHEEDAKQIRKQNRKMKQIEVLKKQHEDDTKAIRKQNRKIQQLQKYSEGVDRYFSGIQLLRRSGVEQIDAFASELDLEAASSITNEDGASKMMNLVLERLIKSENILSRVQTITEENPSRGIIPNVARDAFEKAYAVIAGSDKRKQWRIIDYHNRIQLCKNACKWASDIMTQILWFHDKELGFVDPSIRQSLMREFERLSESWRVEMKREEGSQIDIPKISFRFDRNNHGKGRILDETSENPGVVKIREFLRAPGSGCFMYAQREETVIQLVIKDVFCNKQCRVVVPGSLNLRGLGQLVEFLTNLSKVLYPLSRIDVKGCYWEISLDGGAHRLLVGDWDIANRVANGSSRAGYCHDEQIKLVQVFRGLVIDSVEGMEYISEEAKGVSLVWHSGTGSSYNVVVQGVMLSAFYKRKFNMPRLVDKDFKKFRKYTRPRGVVDIDEHKEFQKMTDFGKDIEHTNFLMGSYSEKKDTFMPRNVAIPMCHANGVKFEGKFFNVAAERFLAGARGRGLLSSNVSDNQSDSSGNISDDDSEDLSYGSKEESAPRRPMLSFRQFLQQACTR